MEIEEARQKAERAVRESFEVGKRKKAGGVFSRLRKVHKPLN